MIVLVWTGISSHVWQFLKEEKKRYPMLVEPSRNNLSELRSSSLISGERPQFITHVIPSDSILWHLPRGKSRRSNTCARGLETRRKKNGIIARTNVWLQSLGIPLHIGGTGRTTGGLWHWSWPHPQYHAIFRSRVTHSHILLIPRSQQSVWCSSSRDHP